MEIPVLAKPEPNGRCCKMPVVKGLNYFELFGPSTARSVGLSIMEFDVVLSGQVGRIFHLAEISRQLETCVLWDCTGNMAVNVA